MEKGEPGYNGAERCGRDRASFRTGGTRVAQIKIDVRGETCPVPLVEVRKALRQAAPGDILEVLGTHGPSKKEIPLAVKALKVELLSVEDEGDGWKIRIRR